MKLAIIGDREVINKNILLEALEHFQLDKSKITEVVCGLARGSDTLGRLWAEENGIPVKEFNPDWDNIKRPGAIIKTNKFGKKYNAKAGFDRNQDIADYSEVALALQPDGNTNGTQDCIKRFEKLDKKVFVWNGKPQETAVKSNTEQTQQSGEYLFYF